MREKCGPNFGIMIDAHSWWRMGDKSYSFDTVAALAKKIAQYGPVWLEEPMPPDDHAAYRKLKAMNILPIATGEHEQDEAGFLDLIKTKAANYIQMDVCCQGGFAMGRRVCNELAKAGLKFAFHSWGTTLEVLAAAHFGVCFPESTVEWLEYPCHGNFGRKGMYPWPSRWRSIRASSACPRVRVSASTSTKASSPSTRGSRGPGRTSRSTRRPRRSR
jgi:L-alanine-DL-glutamate epimerase-like enolase superfamily enzyme